MSANDILVFGETQQDALADITLEMVAAAREMTAVTGGQVIVLILGPRGAELAGKIRSADRILAIDDPQLAGFTPQPYLTVLESVVKEETPLAVLIGSTSIGLDLASTLAARLGTAVVSGCQAVKVDGDKLKVTASFYAGKMLAEIEIENAPAVLTILPGNFRPTEQAGGAQVETRPSPVALEAGAVTFQETIEPEEGDVDITQQEVLVGVGRGIQQEDDMQVVKELAEAVGGVLAASRPIVDQGWLPTTRQVGKSGMTVKPKCFISLGISGAPEHVEGMKDSELVIAVNSDPNAPIFDVADYGVVADLLDVAEELTGAIHAEVGK